MSLGRVENRTYLRRTFREDPREVEERERAGLRLVIDDAYLLGRENGLLGRDPGGACLSSDEPTRTSIDGVTIDDGDDDEPRNGPAPVSPSDAVLSAYRRGWAEGFQRAQFHDS